jgi:hypothetical protein
MSILGNGYRHKRKTDKNCTKSMKFYLDAADIKRSIIPEVKYEYIN